NQENGFVCRAAEVEVKLGFPTLRVVHEWAFERETVALSERPLGRDKVRERQNEIAPAIGVRIGPVGARKIKLTIPVRIAAAAEGSDLVMRSVGGAQALFALEQRQRRAAAVSHAIGLVG